VLSDDTLTMLMDFSTKIVLLLLSLAVLSNATSLELRLHTRQQRGRPDGRAVLAGASNPSGNISWSSANLLEFYTMQLSIGTPPQTFTVSVDLNYNALWIADSTCAPYGDSNIYGCGSAHSFYSNRSSTYKPDGKKFTSTTVPFVTGISGVDDVQIGTNGDVLKLSDLVFGQATSSYLQNSYGGLDIIDGVLGVGYCTDNTDKGHNSTALNSPMAVAYAKNTITSPWTTWWLQRCQTNNYKDCAGLPTTGQITFGGKDDQHCDSQSAWVAHKGYSKSAAGTCEFSMNLSAIYVGGGPSVAITQPAPQLDLSRTPNAFEGPSALLDQIAQAMGATIDQEQVGNVYWIQCNATMPPLVIAIDGVNYTIPGEVLIGTYSKNGLCELRLLGRALPDYAYLGMPFLRQYCQSYNFATGEVAFAKNIGPVAVPPPPPPAETTPTQTRGASSITAETTILLVVMTLLGFNRKLI
jgi:hypothetical protein